MVKGLMIYLGNIRDFFFKKKSLLKVYIQPFSYEYDRPFNEDLDQRHVDGVERPEPKSVQFILHQLECHTIYLHVKLVQYIQGRTKAMYNKSNAQRQCARCNCRSSNAQKNA